MPAIHLTDLTFSYTTRPLLEGVSLDVDHRERAGIIGPNGAGKSTLLRLVAGDLTPESGSVVVTGLPADTRLRVPDAASCSGTVGAYLDAALSSLRDLIRRFDAAATALADPGPNADTGHREFAYDDLLAQMIAVDAWSLDARVADVLAGLGLPHLDRRRPLTTLSPGQRGRLELATLMVTRPPVLLLDEPTNHLDDAAIAFLTRTLRDWPGPVLMASHDRAFLDDVATVLFDLDTAPWQALATAEGRGDLPGVQRCAGNYRDYLTAKQQARTAHQTIHAEQQNEKHALRAHRRSSRTIADGGSRLATAQGKAKKFYADRAASTATRRTRNDDRRLEALAAREVRKPRAYRLDLSLPEIPARPGLAVTARHAAVPGRLEPVTFDLAHGEHLLVTGPNGAGKSTLLQWIAMGAPARATGRLDRGTHLAEVPQRLPRPDDPGFEAIWDSGTAAAGVLHPSLWNVPIPDLSAGNQRRVQLALAAAAHPEILLIDEPTNYLDLDATEALEAALVEWNGTLVVATHDRWLIHHWPGRHLHLGGQ